MSGRFAGVVLAAGHSRRFGPRKLSEVIGGAPIAGHVVSAALEAGLSPLVIVCPKDDEVLQGALQHIAPEARVLSVENDALSDSLRAGLYALGGAKGAFVLLADMPFVDAALLNWIAAGWDEEALAVAPAHEGRRGNPVLLSARAFALAEQISGDRGLGALLDERAGEVRLVEAGPACVIDIDTRADLESARASWGDG